MYGYIFGYKTVFVLGDEQRRYGGSLRFSSVENYVTLILVFLLLN